MAGMTGGGPTPQEQANAFSPGSSLLIQGGPRNWNYQKDCTQVGLLACLSVAFSSSGNNMAIVAAEHASRTGMIF